MHSIVPFQAHLSQGKTMDYKTNKNDLLYLWATIWGIYEEKYNDGS